MCTCREGKGGELSSRAFKMLYKPPGAVYILPRHIRNGSTNQIAENSMFSSEIILIINLALWRVNAINIIFIPFLKTTYSFFSLKPYIQTANGSQL